MPEHPKNPAETKHEIVVANGRFPDFVVIDWDKSRIHISNWDTDGLLQYSGLTLEEYHRICVVIGKLKLETLKRNDLMVHEYLIGERTRGSRCVLCPVEQREEQAIILENPEICISCVRFYSQLDVERELDTVAIECKRIREEVTARTEK